MVRGGDTLAALKTLALHWWWMPGFRLARDGWLSRGSEPRIPAGL